MVVVASSYQLGHCFAFYFPILKDKSIYTEFPLYSVPFLFVYYC